MIRFEATYIRLSQTTRSTFSSSKFIHWFNQSNLGHRIYDSESLAASKFNSKNVNTVKPKQMFGKIKHSNEYKASQKKSVTKSHPIQNKWIEYKISELNK